MKMITKLQDCILMNLLLNKNLITKCLKSKKLAYQCIHRNESVLGALVMHLRC